MNKRVGSSPTLGTTYKPLTVGQGFFFYAFQPVKSIRYVHIRYKFIINPNLKYCHFLSIFMHRLRQCNMKWGAEEEEEKKIELQAQGLQLDTLFSDVIKRYLNEITPTKRGEKHEFNRLNRFLRHPVTDKYISDVSRIGDEELCFDIKSNVLDATFRKLKKLAEREYLHFHDTRREALIRLSKKVDVMTLAKISGHKDISILQNVYYAPDMAEVAELLD
ncbi:tyrosine-type recombinase/integrase [Haemophilus influenzae]|uniref:tyrosine-type recombinase/integrase n=1 Tax=Haemophilus influenzae TaxID=727 RepID=UPI001FD826AF|nr:tyrosine-type recombinase/integrase [Haemophilus influenzae]MCK8951411.1 tyrosine-type recombinase/integrase [Haemophilus influenzae]